MSTPDIDSPRRGRPPSTGAASHTAIMDAVFELLQEKSVRDLTLEEVAKRAKVGKPTLYKWWPGKAALVMAMFHERLVRTDIRPPEKSLQQNLNARATGLIRELNGLFGKVVGDLIAEGQSDPEVLRALYDQHIAVRRAEMASDIMQAIRQGELAAGTDPALLLDSIFGTLYFKMLTGQKPLSEQYGEALVSQVFSGVVSR
ncbi:AcrR family transcriptional regulator [Oxalobacteraceae bacterium GrIS 1.11]